MIPKYSYHLALASAVVIIVTVIAIYATAKPPQPTFTRPPESESSLPTTFRTFPTFNIPVGESVRCGDGTGTIYRHWSEGELRPYLSPEVAASWNATWNQNIYDLSADQCASMLRGPPVQMKDSYSTIVRPWER
jgi:hypothetical protein